MKRGITPTLLILTAIGSLLLSACGAEGTATPSAENAVDLLYTAAAMTLTSSLPAPVATSTPTLPATLTPWPTQNTFTLLATSTPSYTYNVSSSTTCDNSAYVSDVTIPDGTEIAAGESFTKTWAILNTGTCTWTTDYSIGFYSGNDLDGSATALTESVAPNETVYISVDMVAPSTTGSYTGYWRMHNASDTDFGASVYVMITVTTAYTSTPTATETEESTSTPTPTVEAYP